MSIPHLPNRLLLGQRTLPPTIRASNVIKGYNLVACMLLVLGSFIFNSTTLAQLDHPELADTDLVKFHLPINKDRYPSLEANLRQLFNQHDLADIDLVFADHWQQYQLSVRKGKVGIYLSEPHFTAWLSHQFDFAPLVKLAGSISYVIAVERSKEHIFEINDLANRAICSENPIKLDYLLLNRAFENTFFSPEI